MREREAEVVALRRQLRQVQAALHTQREETEREKQHRGRHDSEISLYQDETAAAELKLEVLQGEAVAQHREHTQLIIALEERAERLAKENEQLRSALAASPEPTRPVSPRRRQIQKDRPDDMIARNRIVIPQ